MWFTVWVVVVAFVSIVLVKLFLSVRYSDVHSMCIFEENRRLCFVTRRVAELHLVQAVSIRSFSCPPTETMESNFRAEPCFDPMKFSNSRHVLSVVHLNFMYLSVHSSVLYAGSPLVTISHILIFFQSPVCILFVLPTRLNPFYLLFCCNVCDS